MRGIPVQRASANDLVSIASDSETAPLQVGAVVVFGTVDLAGLESAVAGRLQTIPRLRQRLVRAPFGCGRPFWVDDAEFDIANHMKHTDCPPPGDEAALLELAAALVTCPLPRSRPLWTATLVTGLNDGKTALIVVFHHVLADGIGGLAILANLIDGVPLATPVYAPRPSCRDLATDAWMGRARAFSRLPGLAATVRAAFAELGTRPALAQHCSLNRPIGSRRQLAVVRTDLERLHSAAHRCAATINDALLAAVVGALHTLLAHRGEHVGTIVVSIPVSARRSATATSLGNHTGVIPVALPATGEPQFRLARVAAITRMRKTSTPGASAVIFDPVFRALAAVGGLNWFMNHQRMVHTFVTNLHGPDQPIAIGGATVERIIPVSTSSGNVTLSFAALSYAGTLAITVMVDPDHVPDLPILVTALQTELDTLTSIPS